MARKNEHARTVFLDPRAALLLLVLVTVFVFAQKSLLLELALVAMLLGLFFCSGLFKRGLFFMLGFAFLLALQYYVFPIAPPIFAHLFAILTSYVRKVFPCLMVGMLIVKKIPMRYLILAMRKWRFPQKLIIPLSVTLCYFPVIREEIGHIRDAMKLRTVAGAAKAEAILVSLIFSAANTAEELGAAAVTRGIENPAPKTSVIELRFRPRDYMCIAAGLLFVAAAFWLRRGAL